MQLQVGDKIILGVTEAIPVIGTIIAYTYPVELLSAIIGNLSLGVACYEDNGNVTANMPSAKQFRCNESKIGLHSSSYILRQYTLCLKQER